MTEEEGNYDLSRRKTLAALGTIGAAGAGAGLGTSAFFSDQETFVNNQLVAGELDMKVSWDVHYFRDDDGSDLGYFLGEDEQAPDEGAGYPTSSEDPMFAVEDGNVTDFMSATRTGRHPPGGLNEGEDPCTELADVPDDLEAPIIDLDDVKPGDFGEVTFDFSLCDNPGYVWMTGSMNEEGENGVNEPEGAADGEDATPASGSLWPLASLAAVPALGGGGDSGGSESDGAVEADSRDSGGGADRDSLPATLGKGAAAVGAGAAGLSAITGSASAQQGSLSVTPKSDSGKSATDLASILFPGGSGLSIDSATYTGADAAVGEFAGAGSVFGIESGVILSSGLVGNIEGPSNDADGIEEIHGEYGDEDLTAIADTSNETYDAAVLEFDFEVPQDVDTVGFRFVFGSDEYNEFAPGGTGNLFNDVFGFFLNPDDTQQPGDENIATLPNGDPISINTINQQDNSNLFNNNDPSDTSTPFATEADGFSDVLEVEADVNSGETNTLKLAIADESDLELDSWVLIEAGSLEENPDESTPTPTPSPGGPELADVVQARAWYDDFDNIQEDDEQIFLEGSLREVLDALSSGAGVPLDGDESTDTDFDETGDPPDAASRDCYEAANDVHYVGFEWWVPPEVGNEIQSDSVTFDLGFYTEQCRHNDGSGVTPANAD
jgi:predicted ribosomally synthesized peptide with SipW-like signal peptide